MGPWAIQLLTIFGVAVGAIGSFVSTRLLDRSRWQREEALRWDTKRLEYYGEFANAVKRFITVSQRICAGLDLPATGQVIDQAEGLPILAAAEEELTLKWEHVLMLASPDVIAAGREWRYVAWRLEWLARGRLEGATEYEKAIQGHQKAHDKFYTAIRAELGIVSGDIPPGDWNWTPLRDRSAEKLSQMVNLVLV